MSASNASSVPRGAPADPVACADRCTGQRDLGSRPEKTSEEGRKGRAARSPATKAVVVVRSGDARRRRRFFVRCPRCADERASLLRSCLPTSGRRVGRPAAGCDLHASSEARRKPRSVTRPNQRFRTLTFPLPWQESRKGRAIAAVARVRPVHGIAGAVRHVPAPVQVQPLSGQVQSAPAWHSIVRGRESWRGQNAPPESPPSPPAPWVEHVERTPPLPGPRRQA
jgi:hypothetical protein